MTRDYANKKKKYKSSSSRTVTAMSRANTRGKPNKSLVINFNPMLMLVIIIGSIFIATIFYLEHVKDFVSKTQKELVAAKTKTKSVVKTKKEVISRMPKFEFYHTLPKMEVAINDAKESQSELKSESKVSHDTKVTIDRTDKIDKLASKDKDTKETNVPPGLNKKPGNNLSYSVQLASFKDYKDADELKVKLIMSGFDVYIQTVTLDNGDVWHRVKTKKLTNIADAHDVSTQLQKYNIKSIVVTDRG
jgi:cell division protein FtsN